MTTTSTMHHLLVVTLSLVLLKFLGPILIPFALAILLFFICTGFLRLIKKIPISRKLLIPLLSLAIFVLFFFIGLLFFSSIKEFIVLAPIYIDRFSTLAQALATKIVPLKEGQSLLQQVDWSSLISPLSTILSNSLSSFALFFGNLLLIMITLTFMLAGRINLMQRISSAFSPSKSKQITTLLLSIESKLYTFLFIKTLISAVTALLCTMILAIAQVDLAIFFGFLIFILNFIPNLGSIMASICPISMALLQFGFGPRFFIVSISIMLIQFTIGNVIEPRLTGKGLNISPVVILASLLLWGWLWGLVGMMLAAPLTSALQIIFSHFESTRPVAILMSAESFPVEE